MENKDVQNFALGLIVAVVLFLLLRRELGSHAATPEAEGGLAGDFGNTNAPPSSGCGCGGGGVSAQVIPIGGQSYNRATPYGGSSVVSQTAKVINVAMPDFGAHTLIGSAGGSVSKPVASSGGGFSTSGGSSSGGYATIGGGFANAF